MFQMLLTGEVQLPPLVLRLLCLEPAGGADALFEASWEGQRVRFVAECKSNSSARAVAAAVDQIRRRAAQYDALPMVIVPYLSPDQLDTLAQQKLSGVDLCGNGTLAVPGRLFVYRTGRPNIYPDSAPIKNIYRGQSAFVGRAFLSHPLFSAVTAVRKEIELRGATISLPTVSKTLKGLEEDLIIAREHGGPRLLQPEKLLDQLTKNYCPIPPRQRCLIKGPAEESAWAPLLKRLAQQENCTLVMTGAATGMRLAVAGRDPVTPFYCACPPAKIISASEGQLLETDRFANVELCWTAEPTAFFDVRERDGLPVASPVQAYLEMARGEQRLQQLSEQLRKIVIAEATQGRGVME